MPGIVTLTLSPALDSETSTEHLIPDKKLRCNEPSYAPGGGGINVARAIQNLGGKALAVFPAGGPTGQHLTSLLAAEGVDCEPIEIQAWTRECFNVVEEDHGEQYRFVLPGARLSPQEQEQLVAKLQSLEHFDYLVVSGSHPQGLASDFIPRLLQLVRQRGARCILDTSGAALQQAMQVGGLFMIKPSLHELSILAGAEISEPEQLAEIARNLVNTGKCSAIMVSLGSQGALLATRDGVERIIAPIVKKISTVGAGDSLLGAMVLKLSAGASLSEAARYGVAAGSSAIMRSGSNLCRLEDTQRLFAWLQNHAQGQA